MHESIRSLTGNNITLDKKTVVFFKLEFIFCDKCILNTDLLPDLLLCSMTIIKSEKYLNSEQHRYIKANIMNM